MKPAFQTAAQFASLSMVVVMGIMLYKGSPPLDVILISMGGAVLMGFLGYQIGDILAHPQGSRKARPAQSKSLPDDGPNSATPLASDTNTEEANLAEAARLANQARQSSAEPAPLADLDDEAFLEELLKDNVSAT
jgi:hypothetical protein